MPQNFYRKPNTTEETTIIPTAEELRHQYGDVMNYVKALAAKAKRSAERSGKKDKSKAIEEDLQVILNDLGQALTDDIHRVEADKKPFSHDDLKDIMKKRYSTFSDLASDYFGDEEDDDDDGSDPSDSAKDKEKPKAYYLVDGKPLVVDDPSTMLVLAAAISEGKAIQQFQIDDTGMPVITTVVEAKDKKKLKKSDDPDEPETTDDSDDDDSDDESVKKIKIKFNGKKLSVPVITKTSGSGKNKKTRTYALAAADGSEVFASFAEANDYDDPVVWYELARVMIGVKADGSDKFSYELATASPHKIKYLG